MPPLVAQWVLFMLPAFEITYLLRKRGKTQSVLAKELNVSRGLISNVIHGRTTCSHVAEYIAELVERDVNELFPKYAEVRRRARPTRDGAVPEGKEVSSALEE